MAGIYAAQTLKPKQILLTDFVEVLPLVQRNVDLQQWSETTVSVMPLEWGDQRVSSIPTVDLIILADVLYNQSSHDALLITLNQLAEQNPTMDILLAYKPRSSDEQIFFHKLAQLGWQCCAVNGPRQLLCEIYWISKRE